MNNDDIEIRFPWECTTHHHHSQVVPWCEEQFGPFDHRWYRYGSDIALLAGINDIYRFLYSEDAVLFKLRWS